MANVYIEARPKGRPEGSHIDDYVVEDHAVSVLADIKTQHEAIQWAKASGHNPLVARVRHLKDKKGLIEAPPNWWTPLLSSEKSGKVSNGPGTASIHR
jgi:hypothetical protein